MYYVRIVFFISKEYDFNIENEFTLFQSGDITCKVEIKRREDTDPKVILSYGGFKDREVAEQEGEKLFYSIKKQFIKEGIPINISGGLGVLDTLQMSFANGGLTEHGLKNIDQLFPQLKNKPVRNETLGMEIYKLDEDISTITFIAQEAKIKKTMDFPKIEMAEYKENTKINIAYSLLNSSNAINDLRASFLLKVSAIESLVPDKSYKDDKYCYFINQANKLISMEKMSNDLDIPEEEMQKIVQSIKGSIGSLKKKSIGEKCKELIERCNLEKTYLNLDAIAFFNKCYKIRSEFVHTGIYSGDVPEIEKIRELEIYRMELDKLVVDILDYCEKNNI
ncbi:hypothetical protein L2D08_09250 [Domibacillus sp. PGB-M46]|uniref:hypothetical protein n=1 Tax=Domibacillus sp. PGB-M46 TaxID=2910255 RepID=UPI001F598B56|nr:hypothetical protein [Domibacillus sp. PGB-M46]MCI2254552.1 hypothetical protein [Domibacillus sp. PGB-M46]